MTLLELRAILGGALVAVAACHSADAPKTPPPDKGPGSGSGTGSAAVTVDAPAVADDQPPPEPKKPSKSCNYGDINITGCGGGEVALPDGPEKCGLPTSGDIPMEKCKELCGTFEARSCHLFKGRDGKQALFCDAAHPCMGRLDSEGQLAGGAYADPVVNHLALARRMEAHSVGAFRELAADLARFGAPAELIEACLRAAGDEDRHAQLMAALLVARGAQLEDVPTDGAAGFASLLALALHNEREGVVGETWGALIAGYQAEHAGDAAVGAAMRAIAGEETEHAALSHAIAAWARTQLPADVLDAARADAIAALRADPVRPDDAACEALGWPSRETTAHLLAYLWPKTEDRGPKTLS